MTRRKGLTLTDILITVVIAFVFSVIYSLWGPVYSALSVTGLHINELMYGMWFIAAVVAYLIIRKPFVALLAEFGAAAGETIVTLEFNTMLMVYGFLQGLACEIVFAIFRYKSTHVMVAMLAGVAASISTIPLDWFYGYLGSIETWNLALYFGFRIISGALIAGWFAWIIYKAVQKTGVLKFLSDRHQHTEGL